jgi:hypothetical protein
MTANISILGSFLANSFVAVDNGSGKVEVHYSLSGPASPVGHG